MQGQAGGRGGVDRLGSLSNGSGDVVTGVKSPSEQQRNHDRLRVPRRDYAVRDGGQGGGVEIQESGKGRHPSALGYTLGDLNDRLVRLWVAGSVRQADDGYRPGHVSSPSLRSECRRYLG